MFPSTQGSLYGLGTVGACQPLEFGGVNPEGVEYATDENEAAAGSPIGLYAVVLLRSQTVVLP